jgi:hypothetical protein
VHRLIVSKTKQREKTTRNSVNVINNVNGIVIEKAV